MDTSLRRTASAGPKGVRFRESWLDVFLVENRTRLNSPSLLQCVLHFLGVYYEAGQVNAKLHINFLWLYYKADKLL